MSDYLVTKMDSKRKYTLGVIQQASPETADAVQASEWAYVRSGDRNVYQRAGGSGAVRPLGESVDVCIWPFAVSLVLPDETKTVVPAGSVWLGVAWSDEGWALAKEGKIRGLSMGTLNKVTKQQGPPAEQERNTMEIEEFAAMLDALGEKITQAVASTSGKEEQRFVDASHELLAAGVSRATIEKLVAAVTASPIDRKRFDVAVMQATSEGHNSKECQKGLEHLMDGISGLRKLAKASGYGAGSGTSGDSDVQSPHGPFSKPQGIRITFDCSADYAVLLKEGPGADPLKLLQSMVQKVTKAQERRVSMGDLAEPEITVHVETEEDVKKSTIGSTVGEYLLRSARRQLGTDTLRKGDETLGQAFQRANRPYGHQDNVATRALSRQAKDGE